MESIIEFALNSVEDAKLVESVTGVQVTLSKEDSYDVVAFPNGDTFAFKGNPIKVEVMSDKTLKISTK